MSQPTEGSRNAGVTNSTSGKSLVDYCFATLALGSRYRSSAADLANDLSTFAPGKRIVVLTDDPRAFGAQKNVDAVSHRQRGLFNCWNDKRFAVAAALRHAAAVVFYDADTRIVEPLPSDLHLATAISTDWTPNLEEQTIRYQEKKTRKIIFRMCELFGVDPKTSLYIDDNFYIVKRDKGREKIFLQVWGEVAKRFDLAGIPSNDGTCMGIAATVTGFSSSQGLVREFDLARHHLSSGGKSASGRKWFGQRAVKRTIDCLKVLTHRIEYVATAGQSDE